MVRRQRKNKKRKIVKYRNILKRDHELKQTIHKIRNDIYRPDQTNTLYEPRNGSTYCGIDDGAYQTGTNFTMYSAVFATRDARYLCLVFKTRALEQMMQNKNNDDILILCKSGKMVSSL